MASSTKERILDVAEGLFADCGYKSTSLRDITKEAGVNLAAVNYHFGSKEALLTALLNRRFTVVNELRIKRLDAVEHGAGEEGPELEEIIRAFIAPPFEMQSQWGDAGSQKFLRLVGRIHSETDDVRAIFIKLFDPVMNRFKQSLKKALPDINPTEVERRAHFLVGAMAYVMMSYEVLRKHDASPTQANETLESLIMFGAAGLSTPSSTYVPVSANTTEKVS